MDAIEFIKERHRLCQTYIDCFKCPAHNSNPGGCNFSTASGYEATEQIRLLEEWSAAHPPKTRQSVFLKQYPNARVDSQNIPYICPADAYGDTVCPRNKTDGNVICYDCRREFWSKEV